MCIFLTKKVVLFVFSCQNERNNTEKWESWLSRATPSPGIQVFMCGGTFPGIPLLFFKKNIFLGMRFSTKITWRLYIVHFCRLLRLIKLEIIIIRHKSRFSFFTHPDTSWEALLPLISLNGAESSRPNMKPRSNWVLQTRWEVDLWPVPPWSHRESCSGKPYYSQWDCYYLPR